jgi:Tropinone reductase 1
MLLQEGPEFDRLIERTPLKRVAEPEEIASAVAFLAGKESAFVTGQAIVVDGGVLAALSTE